MTITQPHLQVRSKKLIDSDGLQFKDLNGNGVLDPYEDWRLSASDRAADLVGRMTLDEKVGLMLINTRFMGLAAGEGEPTAMDGVIDERTAEQGSSIFATRKVWPTTHTIDQLNIRHFILRDNFSPTQMATWINAMNELCEATRLGIPCLIASNSRNENGEAVFGMNDAVGIFSTWPGTLGLAAAALGDITDGGDAGVLTEFAHAAASEWRATGIRKGYMYMADVVTDPRWQRIYGTLGEDPDLVSDAIGRIIDGFQGDALGTDSIALTIKHFPGGGPRENGFDPHYKEGKWNCYPTPGSLETYHLPPFVAAVQHRASSFMPYYSAPSIERSSAQVEGGHDVPFEEVGFAFNAWFLQKILREELGFDGYVNSDSGITDNMCWGVEDLPTPARFAKAVNAGTDLIADTNNVEDLRAAVDHGWIRSERIDEACRRLLAEMFTLGLFDGQTYVDAEAADAAVAGSPGWQGAAVAHRKSVTVLKNSVVTSGQAALPLPGSEPTYVEVFAKDAELAAAKTAQAQAAAASAGVTVVGDPDAASAAVLLLEPQSGNYFSATPGLLELTVCEDKLVRALDGSEYAETTLAGVERLRSIAEGVRGRGGRVVVSISLTLPWVLDDIEPLADAVVAGYSTFYDAQFDVLTGAFAPVGVLPLTLPASEASIAVDEHGRCASPNDVPGYDKEKYMLEGLRYALVDADGNRWVKGHGLRW